MANLPFLTAYDPPGTSEGTLDPLGLYQIANQLAVQLVPAVRERMQRIRFLTAMAVGALITEGLDGDPQYRDASPYLVWEWLVVQALVEQETIADDMTGVAGRLMARRAIDQHGYLDARSYLKTPRIFGFHGIYKRLAVHLGILSVDLAPGPNAEKLVDAWARGQQMAGLTEARPLIDRWRKAVIRSLSQQPPRAKPDWKKDSWQQLADSFAPGAAKTREKRYLQQLLLDPPGGSAGALPTLWELQDGYDEQDFGEAELHERLQKREPSYAPILEAIRAYESFARSLQDAFDILTAVASTPNVTGFVTSDIARDAEFKRCAARLHRQFAAASQALGESGPAGLARQNQFAERLGAFAEQLDSKACAEALCEHHIKVQAAKSAGGKRPWFDKLGPGRIYVRQAYRQERRESAPGVYVHDYRGRPIGRFRSDLS